MTKEEIILAFDAIWFEANNSANLAGEDLQKEHDLIIKFINEHFEFVEEYKSCRQELDGYYELLYPDPYKFEELHEGMWVWDEKEKVCTHIITLFVEQEKRMIVEYKDPYGFWHDSLTFEEGRFFPLTKAMQYQEKEVKE